jgi:hypothetical protein
MENGFDTSGTCQNGSRQFEKVIIYNTKDQAVLNHYSFKLNVRPWGGNSFEALATSGSRDVYGAGAAAERLQGHGRALPRLRARRVARVQVRPGVLVQARGQPCGLRPELRGPAGLHRAAHRPGRGAGRTARGMAILPFRPGGTRGTMPPAGPGTCRSPATRTRRPSGSSTRAAPARPRSGSTSPSPSGCPTAGSSTPRSRSRTSAPTGVGGSFIDPTN